MNAPKGPVPPMVPLQDFLDRLAIEEESERLAGVPRAQVEAASPAEALDPARGRAAVQRALAQRGAADHGAAHGPNVVRMRAPAAGGSRRVVWVSLAAAAAVVVAIGAATERDAIEAWLSPAPTATSTSSPTSPPPPPLDPNKERAARLREQAYVDVKKGYYGEALDALDAVRALEPAGDDDPAVRAARAQLAALVQQPSTDHGSSAKPGLGPGERPLQRTR